MLQSGRTRLKMQEEMYVSSLYLIHLKPSKESIDIQKDNLQKMILGRFAKIMVLAAPSKMQLDL